MDVPTPIRPEALLAEAGMVSRLARTLVRRSDLAHDVAQDVMLVALRQTRSPGNLRGWLAAVTRRLAGKAARAQRVRGAVEAEAAPPPGGDDAAARTAERLRVHRRLTDAVLALPEPYRTAVTLRFFDDLPPRAIAQRLGTSSEVVRKRLQRGVEMLRERLDAEFGNRGRWAHAFAAVGLVEVGTPWLLITVLAMNKLAVAAAATLAVGVWWMWSDPVPPPTTDEVVAAPSADPATAGSPATGSAPLVAAREVAPRPRSVAAAPECRVVVVDAVDRPIVDATVQLWAVGSEEWIERYTDSDGRCAFGDFRGPGGALVAADGHLPRCATWTEGRGEHRIVLARGEVIEGTLTVDGQPGAGWRLRLRDVPLEEAVPERIRTLYRWRGSQAVCDRNGAFRFEGLPRGWEGVICLPRALWFAEPTGHYEEGVWPVMAPQRQLDLRATQLPTVRGRVVWRDTGEPVAWPQVRGHATFADGQESATIGIEGERDGTFAIGFHGDSVDRTAEWRVPARRPAFRSVHLWIQDAARVAATELDLDDGRLLVPTPVVVRLDRPVITHFRCIDRAGEPIAGGRVKARGISESTGADGRGTFAGSVRDVTLVGSSRHRIGPVTPRSGKGTADDPLVFVLEPTNVVRLRVDSRGAADTRCRLRSDVLMFAGRRSDDPLDQQLHGVDLNGTTSGRKQADGSSRIFDHSLLLRPDAEGRLTIWSLEPGTSCEFQVLDDFGRSVAARRFRAPAMGEQIELSLRRPAGSASFAGRVVDEKGQPLRGVNVVFRIADGDETHHAGRSTDERGEFVLARPGDLSGARMALQRDGFAEQWHHDLAIGAPRTYTLQPGRQLTVHVVDEQGRPLDVTPVWRDEREEKRENLRQGTWRWRDLPPGVVRIVCSVGADEFSMDHDTARPEATMRVPRPGTLRIVSPSGWPAPADARNALIAELTDVDGNHRPTRVWRPERGRPEQLLPGTWRVELLERTPDDVTHRLGLSALVTIRAGEDVTATLR